MPTIKRKVEMNLPELIEWIWNNDFRDRVFYSQEDESWLRVDNYGDVVDVYNIESTDTFTVEVEEEVTEDTVFDKLIIRYVFLSSKPSYAHSINTCIKEVIEDRKVATHIYLENEDNELQLIWTKEKGLIS